MPSSLVLQGRWKAVAFNPSHLVGWGQCVCLSGVALHILYLSGTWSEPFSIPMLLLFLGLNPDVFIFEDFYAS